MRSLNADLYLDLIDEVAVTLGPNNRFICTISRDAIVPRVTADMIARFKAFIMNEVKDSHYGDIYLGAFNEPERDWTRTWKEHEQNVLDIKIMYLALIAYQIDSGEFDPDLPSTYLPTL
jgi:hypothetical protein